MSVTLGQVSLVALLAAAASKNKAAALGAAVLASGLVKISTDPTNITIPAVSTNGLTKFTPKIPNPNKAQRRKEKCIDLQLKLNLAVLNFKIPSLNLSLILPKLPTLNLDFLNIELSKEIQCVLEALALLATIKALLASEEEAAARAAAAEAGVTYQPTTTTNTTSNTQTTAYGTRSVVFYNQSLINSANTQT